MSERTYRIAQGGLLRCCLASLDKALAADFDTTTHIGKHECEHCCGGIELVDGVWCWVGPQEVTP